MASPAMHLASPRMAFHSCLSMTPFRPIALRQPGHMATLRRQRLSYATATSPRLLLPCQCHIPFRRQYGIMKPCTVLQSNHIAAAAVLEEREEAAVLPTETLAAELSHYSVYHSFDAYDDTKKHLDELKNTKAELASLLDELQSLHVPLDGFDVMLEQATPTKKPKVKKTAATKTAAETTPRTTKPRTRSKKASASISDTRPAAEVFPGQSPAGFYPSTSAADIITSSRVPRGASTAAAVESPPATTTPTRKRPGRKAAEPSTSHPIDTTDSTLQAVPTAALPTQPVSDVPRPAPYSPTAAQASTTVDNQLQHVPYSPSVAQSAAPVADQPQHIPYAPPYPAAYPTYPPVDQYPPQPFTESPSPWGWPSPQPYHHPYPPQAHSPPPSSPPVDDQGVIHPQQYLSQPPPYPAQYPPYYAPAPTGYAPGQYPPPYPYPSPYGQPQQLYPDQQWHPDQQWPGAQYPQQPMHPYPVPEAPPQHLTETHPLHHSPQPQQLLQPLAQIQQPQQTHPQQFQQHQQQLSQPSQQQPQPHTQAAAVEPLSAQQKAERRLKKVKKVVKRVVVSDPAGSKRKSTKGSAASSTTANFQASLNGTGGDSTGTRQFFRNISGVELLEADQEKELALEVQDYLQMEAIEQDLVKQLGRDPELTELARACDMDVFQLNQRLFRGKTAKRTMVDSNMRLVVSIAKQYQHKGLSLQELITEGITGLVRGVEKFDPSKGFKFSTYAHWWVRQAMTRAIAEQGRIVRLPTHLQEAMAKLRRLKMEFLQKHGREPALSEVAKAAGMTEEKVQYYYSLYSQVQSLDQPMGGDKDGTTIEESLASEDAENPEESAVQHAMVVDLEAVINTLPEREATVLKLRYGIGGHKELTLEEIGKRFKVTRERIRQIEAKAIRRLRSPSRQALLKEHSEGLEDKRELGARRSMGLSKT